MLRARSSFSPRAMVSELGILAPGAVLMYLFRIVVISSIWSPPTEINTEQSKHDIAVLVAIVLTADIKATVCQFVQPSALKFVHSIKNPP